MATDGNAHDICPRDGHVPLVDGEFVECVYDAPKGIISGNEIQECHARVTIKGNVICTFTGDRCVKAIVDWIKAGNPQVFPRSGAETAENRQSERTI